MIGRPLTSLAVATVVLSCSSPVIIPSTPPPSALRSVVATGSPSPTVPARHLSAAEAERLVAGRVRATLDALKARDGALLAAIAHPTLGVRFTPYAFVRPADDERLQNWQIANAFSDPTLRTWGYTDGRGDPITLTFSDYHARWIYSRDFKAASRTSYNAPIGRGNTIDNSADVYPDAVMFEAYDPGPDPAMADLRWQSLRLFFEGVSGQWYLIGIVHAEWTI